MSIKKYYTHYLGNLETTIARRHEEPIEVYKSEEIENKLKKLLEVVRASRRYIMDIEKDFDMDENKSKVLSEIRKIEQSIAQIEKNVFSGFE